MKQFLLKIVVFQMIIVFSYPAFVWSGHIYDDKFKNNPKIIKESKRGYGFLANRIQEANKTKNVDVLILGSSLAYRLIDTRNFDIIGIKSFNLGSSSQTPLQTEFLIEQYFDQLNPKLIIWDISPSLFANSGLESFVDLASNFGFHPSLIHQALKIKDMDAFHTLTFVCLDNIIKGNDLEPLKNESEREIYIQGGFVQNRKCQFKRAKPLMEIEIELLTTQKKAFQRLLKKFQNTKLFLVMAPIRSEDYELLVSTDLFEEYVNKQIENFDDVYFFNFNQPTIPSFESLDMFYDEFHLNQKGVELYNKMLLDSISEKFPELLLKNANS